MHMIVRTLLIFLRRKFLKKSSFGDTTFVTMRVFPTDLDLLMHVNNGVYFSFMDFGRWDMIFRNGVYEKSLKNGWYSVVVGETIKFKKSLKLWDKFEIETKVLGHDDKNFFIEQKFLCRGELMAKGLVKVRFLKRSGGSVPVKEVLNVFQEKLENKADELSKDWFDLETRHLA